MKLKVKKLRFLTGRPVCMIHEKAAKQMSLHVGNRVVIKTEKRKIISIVDTVSGIINPNEIAVSEEILEVLALKDKEIVTVELTEHPNSVSLIKKKLDGEKLNKEEINEIIRDIADNSLTEVEVAFFISAVYTQGMSFEETQDLIKSMVSNGNKIKLKGKVLDKHCLPFETPILTKNNGKIEFVAIGDLVENLIKNSNEEVELNLNKDIEVLSWDDNLNLKFTPINKVHKTKSPKNLIKIILRGNRDISLTSEHTIFTLKNGKINNVPSEDVKKGDYILVPRNLNYRNNLQHINLNFNSPKGKNRFINKKLEITPELLRFIGYYLSEGFSNYQGIFLNFGSHEKDIIKDSIGCIKKIFGIEPTINIPHKTAVRVCVYSRELSKVLEKSFNWGNCATNKSIPEFIFGLDKDSKLEFIKSLFEGDGYYRRGYEAIYVTVSKCLANQLSYLLSLMGISVSLSINKANIRKFPTGYHEVSESYYLYTQAREILKGRIKDNVSFINLFPIREAGNIDKKDIGWIFRKALKNQKYVTREKFHKIKKNLLEEDFKKLVDSDLSVLEVKEVKKVKSDSKFVYDLTTSYGRFIAGFIPICIHNCIGGVAGNRTTPIVVSICASAGLIMPKTSSRAITSAAGTADVIETVAKVEFSIEEIKKIIKKTNACLVWGGALGLAPVDDKIIRIERVINIDSTPQLLASILSKKISVGSKYILIDIPCGNSAKVSKKEAEHLKEKFLKLAKTFGLKLEVVLTDGSEPVGNGIGPILEIKDVIKVLKRENGPRDLEEKSVMLAGKLLELAGKAKKSKGFEMAYKILDSGKAFQKFKQIIEAQQGHLNHFKQPKFSFSVKAKKDCKIKHIDNKYINKIARFAGCPEDQAAGIYLYKKKNDYVKKNEKIMAVYTISDDKLRHAKNLYQKFKKKVIIFD